MKFTRGSYGSVSFVEKGCAVRVFQADGDLAEQFGVAGQWCINVGTNMYTGYASRREAVEATANFI